MDLLHDALAGGDLVEFQRSVLDASTEVGAVVGIGKKWVLFQQLENWSRLTGYQAVRERDIARVRRLKHSFSPRALALSGQRPTAAAGVTLDRTKDVLRTGTERFRIVSVYTEYDEARMFYVGVARVGKKHAQLQTITTNGHWKRKPRPFRLGHISRIDFDGQYERALLAVLDAEAKAKKRSKSN